MGIEDITAPRPGQKRRPVADSMRIIQEDADAGVRERIATPEMPDWYGLRQHLMKFAGADLVMAQIITELDARMSSLERALGSFMVRVMSELPNIHMDMAQWVATHTEDPEEAALILQVLEGMVGFPAEPAGGGDGSDSAT
jgi:hypothetical protein